ncbi:IQ motif and SEC7 domain-containing protein 1 isoform X3 [Bacillus rossius redtenbacheri]|uniref:IQ motif and SEC7 domain-containing protein 1 isoform X3 n=1 Tax=Bacillus rossius redtenbacheri TaxID=93214 RepID=UPI002FDEB2F3
MNDEIKCTLFRVPETAEDLRLSHERNIALIRKQCTEIESLKQELDAVVTERDMLLCEVSKLKFEFEISNLKRLRDGSASGMIDDQGMSDAQTNDRFYVSIGGFHHKDERSSCGNGLPLSPVIRSHHLHKSSVCDGGEILKRSRNQAVYELSQDLLDKQIEMLERKYGGMKARKAALTIQRAFRRYTLLKKFATITAMAKVENRLSRRLQGVGDNGERFVDSDSAVRNNFAGLYQELRQDSQPRAFVRSLPLRSMSLRERERRNLETAALPRSQSSRCDMTKATQGEAYSSRIFSPCHCYSVHQHPWDSLQYYMQHKQFVDSLEGGHASLLNRESTLRKTIASLPHFQNTVAWAVKSNVSQARPWNQSQKIPPEVPKRTSSISSRSNETRHHRINGLNKTRDSGSLSSVQSSGSDSSLSADRITCESLEAESHRFSPIWKRKDESSSPSHQLSSECHKDLNHSNSSVTYQHPFQEHVESQRQSTIYKVSETLRKRQYRVGLNLFNKRPERGISYLIRRGFLENSPQGVAKFLITRKGLSKQMIGEYLGNLQNPFSMAVLECFVQELDLSDMHVDMALRKFQTYFRMPGEAQKIERLMEVFGQRYCQCNRDIVMGFRSPDTVFVLAFAIIMLNTDLHTPNLKPERRMKLEDFIKNLRGIDDGADIDRDILVGIYERVKCNEFKPGSDHVTQVLKVQSTIVGKKPNMALPHRRLVCYCRLYEIPDIYKKERPGVHQREVFLFNDLLVITKILSKKKSSVTYTFRQSFPLCGMVITLFEVPLCPFGIRLSQRVDGKVLITFNARNEHDRCKFAEDLRESTSEMDEMENLRIDAELERQKSSRGCRGSAENRDSGVADVEVCPCVQSSFGHGTDSYPESETEHHSTEIVLKRSALSNSLLDIHEQSGVGHHRRSSMGSLDSGMSVSFQPANVDGASSKTPSLTDQGLKLVTKRQFYVGNTSVKKDYKQVFSENESRSDN